MNSILLNLIFLQKMDTEILTLEKELQKIPQEINKASSVFQEKEKQLLGTKNLIAELQKEKRSHERNVEIKNTEIEKLNGQLSQITTNKEYSALLCEIENKKKEKEKIEEYELEIMYKIELQEKTLKDEEKKIHEEKKKLDLEKKLKEEELNKIQKNIEEKKQYRETLLKDIPEETISLYEKLLRFKEGLAITTIDFKKEICFGCYMSLPPQLINEIKPNNKLINCDKCGRFLYWENNN